MNNAVARAQIKTELLMRQNQSDTHLSSSPKSGGYFRRWLFFIVVCISIAALSFAEADEVYLEKHFTQSVVCKTENQLLEFLKRYIARDPHKNILPDVTGCYFSPNGFTQPVKPAGSYTDGLATALLFQIKPVLGVTFYTFDPNIRGVIGNDL
jgi:hypothetical protein